MRIRGLLVFLALIAVLLLAACGGDATPTPAASRTPAATTGATPTAAGTPAATAAPSPASTTATTPVGTGAPTTAATATAAPQPTPTPAVPVLPAILSINVTDAPGQQGLEQILVTVGSVEVNVSGSDTDAGWLTVVNEAKSFDLLAIVGIEDFLGSAELGPGRYNQVRLEVTAAQVTIDGEARDTKLPSGKLRLVGGFDMVAGETTVLTLDFDAERSVVLRGKQNPLLKPTVRMLVRREGQNLDAAATIGGTPDALLEPVTVSFPLTITGSNGKDITFDAPPERIIAYDGSAVEILYALGEEHRIVGTHSFVTYPPATADIPKVGDAFNIDLEQLVAQKPDLVYVFFDRFVPEMEDLGLKVLFAKSLNNNLDETMDHFRLWGRMTGNPEAAEIEVSRIQARIEALRQQLASVGQGPRVYHHTFDFWAPGGDTLMARIYELLKAQLVTTEIQGYAQISPEEVVVRDPEVIVTDEFAQQQVLDSGALQDTSAVKAGMVVVPQRGSLAIAGTRLMDAIEELAELLYPDLFD